MCFLAKKPSQSKGSVGRARICARDGGSPGFVHFPLGYHVRTVLSTVGRRHNASFEHPNPCHFPQVQAPFIAPQGNTVKDL